PETKQPAAKADASTKTGKPSLEDKNRPAGIERPATVDDLKLISGVGPKIEATLHSLGIYTFAQVASWKKAEREWVDGYLSFRGGIERDDWVKQAKALAKGGVAEYIRVFGKKPV
ncbi:MAG: NADH-quinone oxidoreductase subunit E, partial [Mesorhizobium sp.]